MKLCHFDVWHSSQTRSIFTTIKSSDKCRLNDPRSTEIYGIRVHLYISRNSEFQYHNWPEIYSVYQCILLLYNNVNSSIVVDNDSFYTTWIIQFQHRPTYILILWNTGLLFYNWIKQKPQVKHCTFNVWSYLFRYANYRKRRMIILCNISKTVSCLSIKEKSAATCATYET